MRLYSRENLAIDSLSQATSLCLQPQALSVFPLLGGKPTEMSRGQEVEWKADWTAFGIIDPHPGRLDKSSLRVYAVCYAAYFPRWRLTQCLSLVPTGAQRPTAPTKSNMTTNSD